MSNLFLKRWRVREDERDLKKNPYFAIDRESIQDSANNNDDDRHTYVPQIDRDIDMTSLADMTYLFFFLWGRGEGGKRGPTFILTIIGVNYLVTLRYDS